MSRASYFEKMRPYAQEAAGRLNMPASVILAQWAWETAYGTSELSIMANNHAGIKYPKKRQADNIGSYTIGSNVYSKYRSIHQFVNDYVLNMRNGYYPDVLSAEGVEDTLVALGASPWAEYPYPDSEGQAGFGLLEIINAYNLDQFDQSIPSPAVGSVDNLSNDDLKKYAGIGLAAAALFALLAVNK